MASSRRRFSATALCLLASCLLASCLLASLTTPAHADEMYTVRRGDTLSGLAKRFGVSVVELMERNNISGEQIREGQQLRTDARTSKTRKTAPRATTSAPSVPGIDYTVRRGDTLHSIARLFSLDVRALVAANGAVDPDRIRHGQTLRIPHGKRRRYVIRYRVRQGDSFSAIAANHRVRVTDLRSWNPRVATLRAGQTMTVYSRVAPSHSESVGSPQRGRLVDGKRLARHPGYVIRDPHRAYGTAETVSWLAEAFDSVRRKHPRAARVRVHDLSRRRGGRLRDHRSHQSGRDADITYFRKRCDRSTGCPLQRARSADIDVEAQWTLFRHWLESGQAEAIFVDYRLQKALYEHARARGATRAQLAQWFQYPRGVGHRKGVIRHVRNHRDHLHVRFVCPVTDESCRKSTRRTRWAQRRTRNRSHPRRHPRRAARRARRKDTMHDSAVPSRLPIARVPSMAPTETKPAETKPVETETKTGETLSRSTPPVHVAHGLPMKEGRWANEREP